MNDKSIAKLSRNKLKSVKRIFKNIYTKWKFRSSLTNNDFWISIGENCLPNDILRRHNRKSFSSVFSSGRSNIEYVLHMEKEDYHNLLKKDYLDYFPDGNQSVVRSTYYKNCIGQYSERHMQGFEFSHHDPLGVKEDNRAFKRRINRQLMNRGKRKFTFLYHHRITQDSDLSLLRKHLNELLSRYVTPNCESNAILFYQDIIERKDIKKLSFVPHDTGLLEFVFHTYEIWGGDDLETFWAKKDDSLFAEMFGVIDDYTNSRKLSAIPGDLQ